MPAPPRRLQLNATSLSWPQSAQAQESVRQDAALEKGVDLVLDELGQAGIRGSLDLGEEGAGVTLTSWCNVVSSGRWRS